MTHMTKRTFLIHWNGTEAEEHAERLRSWGWEVMGVEAEDGARASKAIVTDLPDVVVIHLTRLPSHGRETARYLRSTKAARDVHIVFVGGEGEALEKTQATVPEAVYTTPEGLRETLTALAASPATTRHEGSSIR